MSTRITTGMVARNVLADLNRTSDRLDGLRSKASSGKEITRPSDNPFATARALQLRESLEGTRQHQRNATDAIGWQESTEQALSQITDVGQRVRTLLIQGGSDTLDLTARKAIAAEVKQLISAAKEHGNASYAGRFIFGGTNTTEAPFPDEVPDAYRGNTSAIAREIGPGVSLQINVTGSRVLGTGQSGDLLGVLRNIATHLEAGDGPSLRGADIKALDAKLDELMGVRAENGANSNRIESALSRLGQFEETTISQLSLTEDADFAKVLIDLNSQQAAYQAALKAGANIVQSSLMDFLR
jgi:flagellar hook-associated protein 3 FlgL